MQLNYFDEDFNIQDHSFSSLEKERAICDELGNFFSFMPNGKGSPPQWLLKKKAEAEVVFYPGSFNPWHLGHRACLDLCPVKNIIVVPDFNPWKDSKSRQRPWEQLKDLAYRLSETHYSIYPGFLSKEVGNPTVDWFPNVKLEKKSLLIGEDSFLSFDKWKNVEELIPHINTLYIAPRGGNAKDLEGQVKKFPNLHIVFLDHHDFEEVSSSKLREK